jgi:hypothetical protein
MTLEQFKNYKFGTNTEIKIFDVDKFYPVFGVDFSKADIEFELGITDISNIQDIRN